MIKSSVESQVYATQLLYKEKSFCNGIGKWMNLTRTGLGRTISRLTHLLMQVFAAAVASVYFISGWVQVFMLDHQIDFWGIVSFFSLGFWKIKNTIGLHCQSDWKCRGSFVLLKLPLLRNNVKFYFLIMSLDVF